MRSLFFQAIEVVLLAGLLGACGPDRPDPSVLRVAVPPNPNMVTLFVVMEQ